MKRDDGELTTRVGTMATLRTFIAVELPNVVRLAAVDLIERLRDTPANVKWVGAAELHWTLKFLGDVPSREIPHVCRAMRQAVEGLASFEIEVRGAGAFPAATRPRTVWLGVGEGLDAFVELHDALERSLAKLGFRSERRRFQPHITLGRVRRSPFGVDELGGLIEQEVEFEAGRMRVAEVVAFSSRLESSGPTYEVLGRAALQGRS
ncbi:MAG: RNA 2',3'-cyclic phosphodiesterase [Planctomycetota bacterium]|nr:MAG: RNA 2',3'-cyclic phosphodiesterase [Planctomycetota bacterium]REJ95412.1 MAG: RNA 2',3'-cyclic phosphodiesterase [Planctomycetota bacterium]REK23550.1 MAG: RNA 2',3'-cyclic phosphodiesterase [Planctomycetota bacterium]REK46061.1 MAG: RNA 2',3'-cyclic phosphodiesterase [Planctomycetota bacterium]